MISNKSLIAKHFGLRGIALFEAIKGVGSLIVAAWLLSLLHKDLETVATHLLYVLHRVLHLSPDGHIARYILRGASRVTHGNLIVFAALAFVYTGIRFTEATGLWLEKEWAEWFALVSGAMYMPYEVYEMARHPSLVKFSILTINALIVWYMVWLLLAAHKPGNPPPATEPKEKEAVPQEKAV
jgi:uncharacterized membrane protein (DUF2068 family)